MDSGISTLGTALWVRSYREDKGLMEISLFKSDGKWLLVRGAELCRASEAQSRWRFSECWAGDHWVRHKSIGRIFATPEEAEAYLEENRAVMESGNGQQLPSSPKPDAGVH